VLGVPCLTLRNKPSGGSPGPRVRTGLSSRDPDRIVTAARVILAARPPQPGKPTLVGRSGRPTDSGRTSRRETG
jgi:hypothetical protein